MRGLGVTRREGLQLAVPAVASLAGGDWLLPRMSRAAADEVEPLNRFPRMVHNYYVDQLRAFERRKFAEYEALETREDAERYVQSVRDRIARVFSGFPANPAPLNARITSRIERDVYSVEQVIFESRPKFYVTANLYLPKGASGKRPGVVGTCGHSRNGKLAEAYQSFAQGLARQGYVCLIYDPIGQGERSQYLDEHGAIRFQGTTHEHNKAGNQQQLVGDFLGTWRAYDGVRALDYLLTRDEVDPDRVGVTGNSGGGTLTTWLCGVEPRWSMAAPACFVTTWRRNLENELPQDSEQCPPRSLALGLDHHDYLAAMAPKPVIILAKERDYFDVRGSEEAFERLSHLYRLLGADDQIELFVGPTTHGFSQENREAMYRFFNAVSDASDATEEPDLVIEKDETLWCTPEGQVNLEGSRTVFDFTRAKADRLAVTRAEAKLTDLDLRIAVDSVLRLGVTDNRPAPDYRILRAAGKSRGYPEPYHIHYAVETDPGCQALVMLLGTERLYSRPPQGGEAGRAVLYVADRSADVELRQPGLARDEHEAMGEGVRYFACDPRGCGDSLPRTTTISDPYSYYGADYFYAAYALMLNRPMLGRRTWDVLRSLDFLEANGYREVHMVARGWGALPAAFAALFSDTVSKITLQNSLTSYHDVATREDYTWPLALLPPGILRFFDLPDVYAALEEKGLTLLDPLNGAGEPPL